MNLCNEIQAFLASAPTERIREYLVDEVETQAQGAQAMRWLQINRVAVFNSLLCSLYDVTCYKVGDTCFANSADPTDLSKWFVSTAEDAEVTSFAETTIPLADDEASAQAMAVEHLKLASWFFGHITPQTV